MGAPYEWIAESPLGSIDAMIRCSQCRREYDEALFELGRTIWCTCGARVGIEPRIGSRKPSGEKRFLADAMLGRLARWLRLLGVDCAFDKEIGDRELVRRGIEEERIILTRDHRLPEEWWVRDIHLLRTTALHDQLAEVVGCFGLAPALRPLTRCSECNLVLVPTTRDAVADRVPPHALESSEVFSRCPGCERVYWEGSHAARIRQVGDIVSTAR